MNDFYVWRGTTGGNVATAANWDNVTTGQDPATAPPGSDDAATIAATGTLTGTGTVNQLILSSTGTLALAKAALSASDITLSSGTVRLNTGTTLTASTALLIAGTTQVTAGAALSLTDGALQVEGAAAALTVTGQGAKVTVTGSSNGIGTIAGLSGGTAQVTVSAGGSFSETGQIMIGDGSGAGTVTVTGSASSASLGTILLGNGGSGTIRVANGGALSAQYLAVGTTGYGLREAPGTGTVSIEGVGSTVTLASGLAIGGESDTEQMADQGSVTVGDGATLAVNAGAGGGQPGIIVGSQPYASGQLTVTGIGSQVSSKTGMVVGYYGTGRLSVLNGATVRVVGTSTSAGLIVGDLENYGTNSHVPAVSSGSMTVSGVGSTLTVASSAMMIGQYGTGTLTISNGGTVLSGALGAGPSTIGVGAGGSGSVTVTGSGSSWTNTGTLDVGYGTSSPYGGFSDTGSLKVAAGATMTLNGGASASLDLGGGGSTGTLLVTGNGSTLTDTGALAVGASGTGTMTVADYGEVTARSLTIGNAAAGGSGTLTLSGTGAALDVQGAASLTAGSVTLAGGTLEVGGNLSLGGGTTLTGNGLVDTGATINAATVLAKGGDLTFIGNVSGTGSLEIASGATLTLDGVVGSGQTTSFSTGSGLLDLGDPTHFASHIAGFGTGDQIDLSGVTASSMSYSGQTLTIHAVDGRIVTLGFTSSYTAANFTSATDGHGGSVISFHS